MVQPTKFFGSNGAPNVWTKSRLLTLEKCFDTMFWRNLEERNILHSDWPKDISVNFSNALIKLKLKQTYIKFYYTTLFESLIL